MLMRNLFNCSTSQIHSSFRISDAALSYSRECHQKGSCTRDEVVRVMLAAATENEHLITVQIGGMDGISNDPMYESFVIPQHLDLANWVPIVFEPVARNFVLLRSQYRRLYNKRGIACMLLQRRAIKYPGEGRCSFYSFNTSKNSLPLCKSHDDWMKFQIGKLEEKPMREFFGPNFDKCITKSKVPCGPVELPMETLPWSDNSVRRIDFLQIDVEGFERNIIHGLLCGLAKANERPLAIHYEYKVLADRDEKKTKNGIPSNETGELAAFLEGQGYVLYDQGEDNLALLLRNTEAQKCQGDEWPPRGEPTVSPPSPGVPEDIVAKS